MCFFHFPSLKSRRGGGGGGGGGWYKVFLLKYYAYQMVVLSFKTSLTYKFYLTSRRTTVSVVKQCRFFPDISNIRRYYIGLDIWVY